jgi:hypothetical protein
MSEEKYIENSLDSNNLYREETYTDLQNGAMKAFWPVDTKGVDVVDGTRSPKFLALTNIQTQDGPAPIQAEIEANHLEEAVNKFQEKLDQVVGSLIEETQKQEEEK